MKYHVRKNEKGQWVDDSGCKPPKGAQVVHYYGRRPVVESRVKVSQIRSNHPHVSRNAAIHPDQVPSFNKECALGTHYEAGTGNLISNSARAQEQEARRRGMSFS